MSEKNISLLCLLFLVISGVLYLGYHFPFLGYIFTIGSILLSVFVKKKEFKIDMFLSNLCIFLLSFVTISTSLSHSNIIHLSIGLTIPLIIFYGAQYALGQKQKYEKIDSLTVGEKKLYLYGIFISACTIVWSFMVYYGYKNWEVETNIKSIVLLFLGTNLVGIWDELFFIFTLFRIWRKHFTFYEANIAQTIIFTTFLYDLGFDWWAPLFTIPFAYMQGYLYEKTHSLQFVIKAHLTGDFILFISILYGYGILHSYLYFILK